MRHEYATRRNGVAFTPKAAELRRGRLVHRPVARATDRCLAALLIGLICAVALIKNANLCRRGDLVSGQQAVRGQRVVRQTLGGEIALLFGYPFLQPAMGVDDESGHRSILVSR